MVAMFTLIFIENFIFVFFLLVYHYGCFVVLVFVDIIVILKISFLLCLLSLLCRVFLFFNKGS